VGPVVSRAENGTTSWGRDGGISVPLPNGRVFWIFGDTPRYSYLGGKWSLTGFIFGSSAGIVPFRLGRPPATPFNEVIPGHSVRSTNQPSLFMPAPHLYMPNGSGKYCNKANGGASAGAARWPTGAALMPDKTNILVPYIGVCVLSANSWRVESWGFALFNWKTSRFTVAPVDVWAPARSGAGLPQLLNRGSPVIYGRNVTFYSTDCCVPNGHIYSTTLAANTTTMRRKSAYTSKPIAGLAPAPIFTVSQRSGTQNHFTMYQMAGSKGQYKLLKAATPTGSWSALGSGTLPKCNTSPAPCISVALHPELSTSSRILVSYYLPGFGPGVPNQHPYPHPPLGHVVMSYIPG
jgi:hypothetical protein